MKKAFLLLMTVAFAACDSDDETQPDFDDYLPLQIGNYWDFQTTGQTQDQVQIHREVVANVNINNLKYYLLVTTWGEQSVKDSSYYRVDDNGSVFVHRKNQSKEDNRFHLAGKDGDEWTYPYEDDEAHIELSVGSVVIGSKTIINSKSYYFDVTQWADEEYTITLAPGIGFVKEYSNAWGLGSELKSAKINGRFFDF